MTVMTTKRITAKTAGKNDLDKTKIKGLSH